MTHFWIWLSDQNCVLTTCSKHREFRFPRVQRPKTKKLFFWNIAKLKYPWIPLQDLKKAIWLLRLLLGLSAKKAAQHSTTFMHVVLTYNYSTSTIITANFLSSTTSLSRKNLTEYLGTLRTNQDHVVILSRIFLVVLAGKFHLEHGTFWKVIS